MKKAIITGGSSGLGYEIVSKLVEKGIKVVNLSRTPCKLKVINIKTDLSEQKDIAAAIVDIKQNHKDADLLILNAGILHRHLVGEFPLEEIDADFAVNTTSSISFRSQLHIKAKSDLKQEDLMDPKYLAQILMSILELPRSVQVSEIIIDRKKVAL